MDGQNPVRTMEANPAIANAATIETELEWFSDVLDTRMKLYFGQESAYQNIDEIPVPAVGDDISAYADIIRHYEMTIAERLVLMLALVPHIKPQLLDVFYTRNATYDRGFTEFGGIKGHNHGGFIPTAETAMFVLTGADTASRLGFLALFSAEHFLFKTGILRLQSVSEEEPLLSRVLILSREYYAYLTSGQEYKPDYSMNFPARRITTTLCWDDLVLEPQVLEEIEEVRAWIQHGHRLLQHKEIGRKIKPGYRCLFYGPPGTGKTLTANLLGQSAGMDVYRVDLSSIVSKFIGETEKNLANLFDQAQHKNWILFFDEADALFGKRTQTQSSNDRYANQEVAYLLQRIEDFPGVVILATNLRANMDEAFARRFQAMVYFPMPGAEHRRQLWEKLFQGSPLPSEGINFRGIAEKHEMAGGAIINVLRYATLMAMKRESTIRLEDIEKGIKREFRKEGKAG